MPLSVALYSPDRGVEYDGRTPAAMGVGGGITARLSLLEALAARGHEVTAYVNCREPVRHAGVAYVPLEACRAIACDVFIAMTTGGELSFAPLAAIPVGAALREIWVQGVPKPQAIDVVAPDIVHVASNFLRDVCVSRWGIPERAIFTCYNGLHQDRFTRVETDPPARDAHAIAYIGPPEKGLAAAIAVLRRLRQVDPRFRLDVFGGAALWGNADEVIGATEPGLTFHGLVGQDALARALFTYEYCLALQRIEEGFGIGVQEAKRAGQIVIASRVGAFAELIRSSQDGWLIDGPHDDPAVHDAAAAAILDLANDGRKRARLRRNALLTPWNWAMAAATVEAYWDHRLRRGHAAPDDALELADGRHSELTGYYYPTPYPLSPVLDRLQPPPRVLVAGYYGHGNLGDEAILDVVLEELRDAVPNVAVTVVSADVQATARRHDVACVHERDMPGLLAAAQQSDLIVLGGGGLLQDHFGIDPATVLSPLHWGLTYCASFPALASLFDKPLALCALGVGPLSTPDGRRFARLVVERASCTTVRDDESLAELQAIGADTSRAEVTADPAFLVEAAPPETARDWLAEIGVTGSGPLVAVAIREWPGEDWCAGLASALDRLVDTHHARIVFVPFQADAVDQTSDAAIAERVHAMMAHRSAARVARLRRRASDVQALFAACDLIVAMRLHAVLLAANAGTPVVALAYDPKVSHAMRRVGLTDYLVELADVDAPGIVQRCAAALAARTAIQDRLAAQRDEVMRAARRNTSALADLLRRPRAAAPPASEEWTAVMNDMAARQIARAAVAERQRDDLAREGASHQATLDALVHALTDANRRTLELLAASPAHTQDTTAHREGARGEQGNLPADSSAFTAALQTSNSDVLRLTAELAAIRTSRAWRAIAWYRDVRRGASGAVRHPGRAIASATRRIVRTLVPAPRRLAIRRAWQRRLMTPYTYVFDRYRRARLARYGVDLSGLRAPGDPGLVSIVLPAYNGARHLHDAIESVLAQTYATFELIVVNDGSTDDTPAIAEAFAGADPRVRVVHQPNRKLPRALSRGFAEARGEFLTWTSCDNRMKPQCLERLVASLRRHPSWDMVYANVDIIGEDGSFLRGSPYYEGYQQPHGSEHVHLPKSTAELNVWPNNSIGAAFLYRSHVPVLLGDYDPLRFVTEDYDYWMRVNALLTVAHADFDDPVYDYRFHGESLTARWEELGMLRSRERLMVFEEFRRDFYLSPMLWTLSGTETPFTRALREQIERAGHLVVSEQDAASLPRLWVPLVRVHATDGDGRQDRPVETRSPGALRVLLASSRTLADAVDEGWDLCVAAGAPSPPGRLSRPRQGWIACTDAATIFRSIDIRAKTDHVNRIEALAESPEPAALDASVVVCTHRYSPRVLAAVESVLDQSVPPDRYEVIVVNNASPDTGLAQAVEELRRRRRCNTSQRLRLVDCPIRGLSAARNAGLAEARGQVVAFLDDDAIADREWLARLCRAYADHPDAGVIGGHIHLRVPEPRPAALRPGWEKYWSQFVTGHSGYTAVRHWWEFPWGANWSARRTALLQAGGFRTQYGRKGDDFWGGEELIAAAIVQRLGYTVAVLPEASVVHDVDASRFTYDHVRRTILAGHLVSYQAQRDLYIPRESGLRTTLAQMLGRHFDAALPSRDLLRDWRYRKQAQFKLLRAQLADLRRRRRRPVVDERP